MSNKRYGRYYILSLAAVIAASAYPIYMGICVLLQTVREGAVPVENYPKYVIPYTPIAIALIIGTALMPLFCRLSRRFAALCGAACSLVVFFIAEYIFEKKVLVRTTELLPLESWQMSLCYVPPEQYRTRTWEAVDVLLGGYSPAFKLHFYIISVIIIVSLLGSIYGFGRVIYSGDRSGVKVLIAQFAASLVFLGMCIWACFTAFYRTGEITVSPLSASLMAVFFALTGIVMGIFVFSFTAGKSGALPTVLPALSALLTTVSMYIGELILLSGNLYRFGSGFFFDGLGGLVLAPVDLLIIIVSSTVTALVCHMCRTD